MAPLERFDEIRRAAPAAISAWEMTMRVKMKEDRQAAPDGATVVELQAGEEYELPQALAERYLERGLAAEVKDDGPAPETEADPGPPEIQALPAAPEKKTPARRRRGGSTA